jgi:hypothetical protein
MESARVKTILRIKKKKETIEKLNTGKFTFKSMFKSTGEKANQVQSLLNEIQALE